ncbi:hypothetical protein [Enterococcus mundtii]|uniref:hypothetical protein n=1 Tax=Enterococcus mundtii TaxID=53346 RepID=UPI0011595513|nr:hypothetical protein [Enterococcus mundtii]
MNIKRFFSATFEESLHLEDDRFVKDLYAGIKIQEQEKRNLHPLFQLIIYILMILLIYGLYYLINSWMENEVLHQLFKEPKINFVSMPIFWFGLLIFSIISIFMITKMNDGTRFYFIFINLNIYMIWLMLSINLFFITFFIEPLTISGILILILFQILSGYIIFEKKLYGLAKQLFGNHESKNQFSKFIERIVTFSYKLGGIFWAIILLLNFIFPSGLNDSSDITTISSTVIMWMIVNISFTAAEVHISFPYLLYGYYKNKFQEEYREWEGKGQLEWYGEKYFNKHIKGTAKEIKEKN